MAISSPAGWPIGVTLMASALFAPVANGQTDSPTRLPSGLDQVEQADDVAGSQPGDDLLEMDIGALRTMRVSEIDPIVTAVSKKPETVSEAPGIVDVITAKDIEQFGAKNLHEVLQWATSVYMCGTYALRRNCASIRGDRLTHNDNHVLTLINGRPFRDVAQGGVSFSLYTAFPIETIDRVEVMRGPGSVLYGTNGYAGVINVVTKKPDGPSLHVSALGGSYGTQQYAMTAARGDAERGAYAGAKYARSTGWPFAATDESATFDSANYGEDNLGVFAMYRNAGFSANVFVADTSQEHQGPVPFWPTDVLGETRVFADVGYLHEFCSHRSIEFHFTYNYSQVTFPFDPLPQGFSPFGTFTDSQSFLLEGTYRTKLTDRMDLLAGAIVDIHRGRIGYATDALVWPIPGFSETWYGVYLQAEYHVTDWLTLVGGMQGNIPGEVPGGIVPRAAVIASLGDHWTGKFLYGQAFRSPYQFERSFSAPGVLEGNPNLRPETVQTFEAQLAYHTDTFRFATTWFQSDYFDLIGRDVSVVPITYENGGRMQFQGVEFENQWRISEQLRWLGSVTYQDNVRDGVHNTTHMPNWMAKMGAAYSTCNGWSVGLFDTFYGTPSSVAVVNPGAAIVNPVPKAYHLMSLNVTLDLDKWRNASTRIRSGRSTRIQFLVQNLLDEPIHQPEFGRRNINSIPAGAGRTFYGGLHMDY